MADKEYVVSETISAKRIKNLRKSLGLTQKQFAKLVNCSKPTIERWEVSEKPIKGPIAFLIQMLEKNPEYLEQIVVPKKRYPLRLWYMHGENVCTIIDVNELQRKVMIWNYTNHVMFRAFGVVENPNYEEYCSFLESRCFPKTRDKLKIVLKDLDIPFYDPLLIIEKTEGRIAEDNFWIRIER